MKEDLTCIIVDDEAKARKVLRSMCVEYCSNLTILAEADSVDSAKELIDQHNPDFVFLDIRMPVKNGFQLMESYDPIPFKVIFTTAYDEYAVQAFKFAAVEYLLKPIDIDELVGAVEKIRKSRRKSNEDEKMVALKMNINENAGNRIALSTAEGYIFVSPSKIIRCEAYGNYTRVFQEGTKPILITKTLKYFDELLTDMDFFRAHKSHLINLHHTRQFLKGKAAKIIMSDGSEVEVSVRRRDALVKTLSSFGDK